MDDPIGAATEVLGDRWTLRILRDVVFADRRFFRALLTGSPEGIATNILADRLVRLVEAGLLVRGEAGRGQRARYSLTEAGIRAVPVLLALEGWGRGADGVDPVATEALMADLRARHLGGG